METLTLNRDRLESRTQHNVAHARRILIGYSMRSGSTLLQHMLGEHSMLSSYSDLTSYPVLLRLKTGCSTEHDFCLKPMDIFYLWESSFLYENFNKFLWIARDPRDSYLSSIESGYAYLFWPRGRKENDIDVGLLRRWKRIYGHYFRRSHLWYLVRYEDLVARPYESLERIFDYLNLPFEDVVRFGKFNFLRGGDYKICRSSTLHSRSVHRYERELNRDQLEVFQHYLSTEMDLLGYD